MLYFWVYITFFSWPLTIPYVLNTFLPSSYLPERLRHTSTCARLPDPILTITVMAAMCTAVYFNTIIHPFTLADNRHYVFYVFRILLRKPWIRFAAIPIYFLCAWLTIITLSGPKPTPISRPPPQTKLKSQKKHQQSHQHPVPSAKEDEEPTGPKLSFVLIWLASTSLSLITAPLVEPRYYIIPWIMWRIHVPSTPVSTAKELPRRGRKRSIWDGLPHRDYRLYLETAWYLLINVGTGYMFLYRGFAWDQEPGVVQRFMW